MNRTVPIASLALLLALGACSDSGGDKAEPKTTASPATSASFDNARCNEPQFFQDHAEQCGNTDPTAELKKVKVGEPFQYQQTYSEGSPPNDWQITVTKIQCGIAVIPQAADNPAYDGGNAQYIDYKAPAGKQFCRVEAQEKNVGRTSSNTGPDFGDIVLDQGEFAASSDDERARIALMSEWATLSAYGSDPINPGSTATWVGVWTVPAGSVARGVLFPASTVYSGPAFRVEVR